jgi:UDP-N-acetylmuramate--alanine ligase
MDRIRRGLSNFPGVKRRLEKRREAAGVTLMDDYGHHPTEIAAILATLRPLWKDRIICLFQPHRYTRVRDEADRFASCFEGADLVVVTKIYAAGEDPIKDVDSRNLVDSIRRESGTEVKYLEDEEAVRRHLPGWLREGDLLVTLGAGDVWRWGEGVLSELEALAAGSEEGAEEANSGAAGPGGKG